MADIPKNSFIIDMMCDACSCGSSTQLVLELNAQGTFNHDFECDNCGSKFCVAVYPGTADSIESDEEDT